MILFFWTVIKEGTYLYRRLVIKDQSESAGFFLCALVTSDDRDDVIVLGMPQQRGHMLAIFSPLYLSQWNRGELGGFDSTLHLSHAYKHPSPPSSPSHVCHFLPPSSPAAPVSSSLTLSPVRPSVCLALFVSGGNLRRPQRNEKRGENGDNINCLGIYKRRER